MNCTYSKYDIKLDRGCSVSVYTQRTAASKSNRHHLVVNLTDNATSTSLTPKQATGSELSRWLVCFANAWQLGTPKAAELCSFVSASIYKNKGRAGWPPDDNTIFFGF